MATHISASPGTEGQIPLGRRLLERLKWRRRMGKVESLQTVVDLPTGERIVVRSVGSEDMIYITGGVRPWFYFMYSRDSPSGSNSWISTANRIDADVLREVDLKDTTAPVVSISSRGVGSSVLFLRGTSSERRIFSPGGSFVTYPDPAGGSVSGTVTSSNVMMGRSRYAAIIHSGSGFYCCDGSFTEMAPAISTGGALSSIGALIVGEEGEEDIYYYRMVGDASNTLGARINIYKAQRSQPVDGDGIPTAISPTLVEDHAAEDAFNSELRLRAVANDSDILTVYGTDVTWASSSGSAGPLSTTPGTFEIRINGTLYWSSPGTGDRVAINGGVLTNVYTDHSIFSALGWRDKFAVVLLNTAGWNAINPGVSDSGEYGNLFIRELVFTRQPDGSYTTTEYTYSEAFINNLNLACTFCDAGHRMFVGMFRRFIDVGTAVVTMHELSAGWFAEGIHSVVESYGFPADSVSNRDSTARISVGAQAATTSGVVQAFIGPRPTYQAAYSNSETLSYTTFSHPAPADSSTLTLSISQGVASGEVAWFRGTVTSSYGAFPIVISSDGTKNYVPVMHGAAFAPDIYVDEVSGDVYGLLGDTYQGVGVSFGRAQTGQQPVRNFRYTNSGAESVTLTSISVPSGYTLTSSPGPIGPGSTGTFQVRLDGTLGTWSGNITFDAVTSGGGVSYTIPVTGVVTGVAVPLTLYGDGFTADIKSEHTNLGRVNLATEEWEEVSGGVRFPLAVASLNVPVFNQQYVWRLQDRLAE